MRRMSSFRLLPLSATACRLLAAVAGLACVGARADVLVLSNGDHLTGHVVKEEQGKITFHSDVLGDVIVAETSATVEASPASPTPTESMVGIPPASEPAPSPPKAVLVTPATPQHPAVVAAPKTPWSGKVEAGYNNQLTNVRTVSTSVLGEVERTVGSNEYLAKARYLYGRTDGTPTTDQQGAEFRYRHNLSSRLFTQSDSTYQTDKIQLINFDGEENAGLGYKLFASPRQTVDFGGGVTGQYLNASGVQRGFDYLGNAFQDFTYKLGGRYTFLEDASAQYSPESRARYGLVPSLAPNGFATLVSGDVANYAYKLHATLEGKISQHLSLNLHWEYEFDNVVLDPANRSEERITTTLGYGF
jgi:putative salt-induced outer membrane protein YdiY